MGRLHARVARWAAALSLLGLTSEAEAQGEPASAPQPKPAISPQPQSEPTTTTEPSAEAARTSPAAEAEARFKRGVAFFQGRTFDRALAEFLRSFELVPTWRSSSNAAMCLKNLGRLDEALEMFERVLRDFRDFLPDGIQSVVRARIVELRGRTGTITVVDAEAGASLVVSGRRRGEYPSPSPLSVMPGSHVVRVYKSGHEPFETGVDIAPGQAVRVAAPTPRLARSGRLSVTEQTRKTLDVVVDGFIVGKTPWAGSVAVGVHSVRLAGEESIGTPPQQISIGVQQTTELELAAEDLGASMSVAPKPLDASVAVDGIFVGRGAFEGRLRPGAHTIKVIADGYAPETRNVDVKPGAREALTVELKRDMDSPRWAKPSKFTIEIAGGAPLIGTLGGGVGRGCINSCQRSVGQGTYGVLQAGYERGNGFSFGLLGGYTKIKQESAGRVAALSAVGRPEPGVGVVNDTLELGGFLVGAFAGLTLHERYAARVRIGAGAVFGSFTDTRVGTFALLSTPGLTYGVGPLIQSSTKTWLFLSPELRTGYRLSDELEVTGGISALLFMTPTPPMWRSSQGVNASADGYGQLQDEELTSSIIFTLMPVIGVRYDF